MTSIDAGHGPPERESQPVGSGLASQLSTPIKNIDHGTPAGAPAHAAPPVPTAEAYLSSLGPIPRTTSCASCRYGIVFEDGRRACRRHFTSDDVATLSELDRRARILGFKRAGDYDRLNDVSYPYGARTYVAMRRRLLEWAEANQLRYADRSHACPTGWLVGQRCPGVRRCQGLSGSILRWLDHAASFTGPGGLRLVTSQPYFVDSTDAPPLAALRAINDLTVSVSPPGHGWYGHGTWFVMLAGFPAVNEAAA